MVSHSSTNRTQIIFLFVILAITLGGAVVVSLMVHDVNKKVAVAKEDARPRDITIIKLTTPTCKNCFSLDAALGALKSQQVNVKGEREVIADSDEGKALVKHYSITKLPTYLVEGEVKSEKLASFFSANGEFVNNAFVFRHVPPVYIDPADGKERGGVTLLSLVDPSCKECYNVATHKTILQNGFGIALTKEQTITVASAEGQRLVAKYSITRVPTILLSPDAKMYAQLEQVWPSVGSIEKDGWHVFRKMESMGPVVYKDLAKNKVIKPVQPKK